MKREREPWTYDRADRMYREDGYFRTVVDSLYHMIEHLQLTPAELRAAAMYAVVRWEMYHPKPVLVVPSGALDPDVLREMQQPGSLLTAAEYLRQREVEKREEPGAKEEVSRG